MASGAPPTADPAQSRAERQKSHVPQHHHFSAHPSQLPQLSSSSPSHPSKALPQHHSNAQQHQQKFFQNMLLSQQPVPHKQKLTNRSSLGSGGSAGDSSNRQLLPILVCLVTFATVLSVLVIYMDTTEIRHQQFRLNMTRDYELQGISQDNPGLISYVRQVHLHPSSTGHEHQLGASSDEWQFRGRGELTPQMAQFVAEKLLGGRRRGVFVQSMTGANEALMTAPWLVGGAQWTGVLVEPDPRKYFELRKLYGPRGVDVVHACVSPNEYPKEVTLRAEDEQNEVRIDSVGGGASSHEDEDAEVWFHSRVKCFPLYTILLATNRTNVDLLSIGCHGQHLQVRGRRKRRRRKRI